MNYEYELVCLRDSLLGTREKRANTVISARVREGWDLARMSSMRVLGSDVGLHLLFRRERQPVRTRGEAVG